MTFDTLLANFRPIGGR